ncbi:MAG: phosphonate C-P lyase system protein PhnH [Pseudomonadota bacterium]
MVGDGQTLKRGFRHPAIESQRAFRALMQAWACPGSRAAFDDVDTPEGWNIASAVIALTLCDGDTPVWLSARAAGASDWLKFHCGSQIVDAGAIKRAQFAVCHVSDTPELQSFNLGTATSPEDGATLILMSDEQPSDGPAVTLAGPGIETTTTLDAFSLPDGVWAQRALLARLYPAGLDFILTDGAGAVCIPRTCRVQWEQN